MKSHLLSVICAGAVLTSSAAYAVTTIDFDSLSAGEIVTVLEGVTFSSNTGLDLVVSDQFDTTSGANYLGVDDGGFEVLFPGDIVTLDFATPVTSLTVHFISSPLTPGSAFEISTLVGSAASGATPDIILGDGGEVFPVNFTSVEAFASAELLSPGAGLYSYNIDDISFTVVPLPTAMWLFASGLMVLGHSFRRHGNWKTVR